METMAPVWRCPHSAGSPPRCVTLTLYACMVAQVIIGSPDLKANHSITQVVEVVGEHEKYEKLRKLLAREMGGGKVR